MVYNINNESVRTNNVLYFRLCAKNKSFTAVLFTQPLLYVCIDKINK